MSVRREWGSLVNEGWRGGWGGLQTLENMRALWRRPCCCMQVCRHLGVRAGSVRSSHEKGLKIYIFA